MVAADGFRQKRGDGKHFDFSGLFTKGDGNGVGDHELLDRRLIDSLKGARR